MIKPAGHRVLVRPEPIEKTTKSGIVVVTEAQSDKAKAHQRVGVVVGIGCDAWKAFSKTFEGDWGINLGDTVLYNKYSGTFVDDPFDFEEYVMLVDEDIIAVLDKDTKQVAWDGRGEVGCQK